MARPKKRGPGRPKGSKTKKRGPGRPPKAKGKPGRPSKVTKAAAPKKALSRSPMKAAGKTLDLVAGKFVIAAHGAVLLGGDGSALSTPEFSGDHSREFSDFQVFDSRGDAQLSLSGLRERFGLQAPAPSKTDATEPARPAVDLSFLDEDGPTPAPTADSVFEPVPMTQDEVEHTHDTAAASPPPASFTGVSVGAELLEALTVASVEPAKAFFATSYTIGEDNGLSKRAVWKEKAVSLAAAVKTVKLDLDAQASRFKSVLKEFDTKVAVARKERVADLNDAERVRDNFLRVAKTYG